MTHTHARGAIPGLAVLAFVIDTALGSQVASAARPNFIFIAWEDTSPHFGCYGDTLARTPVTDRLAAEGFRCDRAFSVAGVCAPSRSAIISARWPVSLGSQHMRSDAALPPGLRCFPAYLRDAGYYCYNTGKTDYNFAAPKDTWDASGGKADWAKRKEGQPFFGVYNFVESHQGRAMKASAAAKQRALLPPEIVVQPLQVTVPPYYPDTPAVRQELANVYNNIALADIRTGQLLGRLKKDGLAEDTIVILFGDHGDGIPRVKGHVYHEGLHVQLVIRIPAKFRDAATPAAGGAFSEPVQLMDLGPTVLSLAGIKPPAGWDGRAFLGAYKAPAPELLFGIRDRINSAYNFERAVFDGRWHYIRNFRPDLEPHAPVRGHEDDPVLKDARRLHREGTFTGPAAAWLEKAGVPEELYDLQSDPSCVNNLAAAPAHRALLEQRRAALRAWQTRVKDLGFLPESIQLRLAAEAGSPSAIPASAITPLLALASPQASAADLLDAIGSQNAAERFWAVLGLGRISDQDKLPVLRKCLSDKDLAVACAAVWGLYRFGQADGDTLEVLHKILQSGNYAERLEAIQVAHGMGPAAATLTPDLQKLVDLKSKNYYEQYLPTAAGYALEAIAELKERAKARKSSIEDPAPPPSPVPGEAAVASTPPLNGGHMQN